MSEDARARDTSPRDALILRLGRDRILAHQTLFKHRHAHRSPDFHANIINLWHSAHPRVLVMAFREAGKSSIAEEAFVIGAAFELFHNAIIVGSTEKRATERLRAIKHELLNNELLTQLFGPLGPPAAPVWNEAEIILGNGVRIIAAGRGQSLRGTKHLHYRPDFAFCDDIEDREHVATPDAREQTQSWFINELLPALDRDARLRMNATPLDRDSLPMRIQNWPSWHKETFPIERAATPDDPPSPPDTPPQHTGRVPLWPGRYPLPTIDAIREQYTAAGDLEGYAREYLCVAEDPRARAFTASMFRTQPRVRTWQTTTVMIDPARTTKQTSATTGWAVWSWLSSQLVVWDAGASHLRPDEIVELAFRLNADWQPVTLGVEEDGLNEFILQPLRHEQLKRATLIPLLAVRAPRSKLDFIAGLQPHFMAGEVTFAKPLPELERQLLSFPTGKIDAPNALAYALKLRPGVTVYEDFASQHVAPALPHFSSPRWLALNTDGRHTTAVAVQYVDGALHVLWDAVREGDPGAVLATLVQSAQLELGPCRLVAGDRHYSHSDRFGLRVAVAKLPGELRRGGAESVGRGEIRRLLRSTVKGWPAFRVTESARWTLNGFGSGYARVIDKRGQVADDPAPGIYATLLQGLEAFAALLKVGTLSDSVPNIRVTEGGQRYVSALPNRQPVAPSKDAWFDEPARAGHSLLPDR